MSKRSRDHTLALIARGFLWTGAILGGWFFVRGIPELRRYIRMRRM